MYFKKQFSPLVRLDMHGNFQLKKSLVYQIIFNVFKKNGI
jgi:hypothetical protein